MPKYFLYARKSTDDEDRQILSIEAQITELKEFAAKEKLEIAASLCEAKTAKEPGRIVFNEMIERIESGEADGILAWHPDRLARNSIDGGRIIYLADTGKINFLKFPTFWFDNTPQGKFMLNIAFGQSKYYVDNLSENVKRGIRQKLRRGEYPGLAPVGYLNDLKTHTIILDPKKYKIIKKVFGLYSTGEYCLENLISILCQNGVKTKTGKPFTASMIQHVLKNTFYYGVFKINGETYQGIHKPIITKKLFDEVQTVMKNRSKKHQQKNHGFAFTGFISCGTCGCSITAEIQKGHIYYHCTKKWTNCDEKYIREELLIEQFKEILQKASLPDDWAENILLKIDRDEAVENQSSDALVLDLENQKNSIKQKANKLLDSHLDSLIDKAEYLDKKEHFINDKLALEEKIKEIKNKGDNRLEPIKKLILDSISAKKATFSGDFMEIRNSLKTFGSNFILKDRKFGFLANFGWEILARSASFACWQGHKDLNLNQRFWRPLCYHYTMPPYIL